MNDIRIATGVIKSIVGDISHNLDRIIHWTKQAAKEQAQIICFPELCLTGYARDEIILQVAQTTSSDACIELADLASSQQITILAGMTEKDKAGHIYLSHLIFKPNKEILVYRKLHLSPPEKDYFTQGDTVPVFEKDQTRFGIQLCYDAHFPGLSTVMAQKGVDIIFMPHASPFGTPEKKFYSWMRHLPARAFDNGVFVVACNQTGKHEDGLEFPGISLVIDPLGEVLAKDISDREGIMTVDLMVKDLIKVREHRMRYFLPNQRQDLY